MKTNLSCLDFCVWTAMSKERCLQAERTSGHKVLEKRQGARRVWQLCELNMAAKSSEGRRSEREENRTGSASESLQEDRCEEMENYERGKQRCYRNDRCSCLRARIQCVIITISLPLAFVFFILYITNRSPVKESRQQCPDVDDLAFCGPACPSGWIGYEGKCYFFSDEGRNWTSGQSFCTSYSSSLAVIENEKEKAFIMRYKCSVDHWIGLRKDPDPTWKWADGTELNARVEIKGGGGDCAFLNSGFVSSRCYIQRNWICSHQDAYMRNKNSSTRR